jgi:hypothetical protein
MSNFTSFPIPRKDVSELNPTEQGQILSGLGIDAGDFGKQLLKQPTKRFAQDALSVPLSYAAHTLGMTQAEWRKAAKFTYTKTTVPTGTVNVGNGATHVKFLRWDGEWSAVKAVSGNTGIIVGDWGAAPAAPFNSRIPKFGAIVPCDASGAVTGDLTSLGLNNNQITSFDGTGLSSLTILNLSGNQLTSFDGTGLSLLTSLDLNLNQLTSFDGTGLSSLVILDLNNNQLTSFDGTGLSSLAILGLNNNQIASFDGTGLSLLTALGLSNNQITSFDGTGLSLLTALNLSGNQIASILLPEWKGEQPYTWTTYALDLANQQMTTDAVYLMVDSIPQPAIDQPYPIDLTDNPCDGGTTLVEDGIYTQAQIEALLIAKGYTIILSGGTI